MATTGTVGTSVRRRPDPDGPAERAPGSANAERAAMATFRWAFAFYGGFSFLSLGTIAATWLAP